MNIDDEYYKAKLASLAEYDEAKRKAYLLGSFDLETAPVKNLVADEAKAGQERMPAELAAGRAEMAGRRVMLVGHTNDGRNVGKTLASLNEHQQRIIDATITADFDTITIDSLTAMQDRIIADLTRNVKPLSAMEMSRKIPVTDSSIYNVYYGTGPKHHSRHQEAGKTTKALAKRRAANKAARKARRR